MKIITLALSLLLLFSQSAFALDWKNLHEQADKLTLQEALANSASHPDSPEESYILGLVYLNLHQDKEALDIFSSILNRDPQMYPAQWGVAEVLRRQHSLERSEGILKSIVKSHPGFSPAYITLAYIKYTKKDFENSARFASKVIGQGAGNVDLSNYVRAYLTLAGAKGMIAHYGGPLSKIINGTSVFPLLKKAQKLQPDSAGVFFGLGCFYLLAPAIAGGNPQKALGYLEQAVKADPLFADAYVRLAQAYKLKGDTKKYQACMNTAVRIDPGNELALDIQSGKCDFICIGQK
ncbi:MAG: tetratricopeptide repeat protein [Candidatus Omnitrophica bacterium]|nr:tetratricopeptide repeat protein [Candidatus Omnitrophota bacterium]